MIGLLVRLAKFSLVVLVFLVVLPFHLMQLGGVIWNSLHAGAGGGMIMFLVLSVVYPPGVILCVPWAIGCALVYLAINVYQLYFYGDTEG